MADDNPTHIKDLKEDPRNRRKHTPRNIGMIADSLQETGAGRSIVIDENNQLIAGHGLVDAAGQVGITKVTVVEASGNEIIAVKRSNLTPEQKRKMAIYDNRTGELSEWDIEQLVADQADGLDLSFAFTDEELAKAIGDEESKKVTELKVERPADIVWVLMAIPMEKWPETQQAIEKMQIDAKYSNTIVRPKDP